MSHGGICSAGCALSLGPRAGGERTGGRRKTVARARVIFPGGARRWAAGSRGRAHLVERVRGELPVEVRAVVVAQKSRKATPALRRLAQPALSGVRHALPGEGGGERPEQLEVRHAAQLRPEDERLRPQRARGDGRRRRARRGAPRGLREWA